MNEKTTTKSAYPVIVILLIAAVGLRYADGYYKGYSAALRDIEKKKFKEAGVN